MPDLTVIHASGKWDLLSLRLGKDMPRYQSLASLVIVTEANHTSDAKIASIANGWGWFRSPLSDCVIFWNPVVWEAVGAGSAHKLTDLQYRQKSGAVMRKFYALKQALRHVATDERVTVVASHMPLRNTSKPQYTAVIKGKTYANLAGRLQVSNGAIDGMVAFLNSIPGKRLVSCDWNIPERTAAGRALLGRISGPTNLTRAWVGHIDKADTKRSLIDGVMTDLAVRESTLMPVVLSSDHQPVQIDLTIPAAVTPRPTTPEAPVATSQNGYTANVASLMASTTIPGTSRKVQLRKGAPGELLAHFAGWFDKNIESVDGGILDDWGYANRPIRGSSTGLSNHASGTALDLNAPRHPLGKRGTFSAANTAKIRARLKDYDGAIRWGGDYVNRADEMHFEIVASPEKCAQVLAKVSRVAPPAKTEPALNRMQQAVALLKQIAADPKNTSARRARARAALALLPEA